MVLELKEIILLKYLTKYNIKVIKDYTSLYDNFDLLLNNLIHNFKIDEKLVRESQMLTEIAIDKLKYYDIKTLTIFDDKYPIKLKKVNDAPLVIYYKGVLNTEKLAAVVGSRIVSKHGKKITYQIVDWLNEHNYGIVSGLAIGIDSFAHQKAIENNQYTIAVLPNSLDSIYPPINFRLANEILEKSGCIISELVFGVNRGNKSFVQRNRIQSALSEIVIPIEMGINSGTMHTVDFAKRYNKKVGLFKPTPMLSELENYFGIIHLINNPAKNQSIFTDKDSFDQLINSLDSNNQLDLNL